MWFTPCTVRRTRPGDCGGNLVEGGWIPATPGCRGRLDAATGRRGGRYPHDGGGNRQRRRTGARRSLPARTVTTDPEDRGDRRRGPGDRGRGPRGPTTGVGGTPTDAEVREDRRPGGPGPTAAGTDPCGGSRVTGLRRPPTAPGSGRPGGPPPAERGLRPRSPVPDHGHAVAIHGAKPSRATEHAVSRSRTAARHSRDRSPSSTRVSGALPAFGRAPWAAERSVPAEPSGGSRSRRSRTGVGVVERPGRSPTPPAVRSGTGGRS